MNFAFDPKRLDTFPTQPGVYLMKDASGEVIYVGKAINLRRRIKQYFIPGRDGRVMIPYLVAKIDDIDAIVVTSEKEALLLESNLIKKHQPHYNALLKDDKSAVALAINKRDPWPAVRLIRYRIAAQEAGTTYFGPYTSAYAAHQTLDLLNKLFPLRRCSDAEFARRTRPCILYQMKRCAGPCANKCTHEEYDHHLARTIKFLKGQDREVIKDLYDEMDRLSSEMEFEKAGQIFQKIRFIEKTIEAQHVDKPSGGDADAIGLYRQGDEVMLAQLFFREGRLVGVHHFDFKQVVEEDEELISSFLLQAYSNAVDLPPLILLPIEIPSQQAVEEVLHTHLHLPLRGERRVQLQMAQTNAKALFETKKDATAMRENSLLELQETLGLVNYPARIECVDNSHTGGSEAVAALVAFTDGVKDTKRYRTYRLKASAGTSDDYASMYEVLMRRYRRAKEENDLPDLLIVDGGKGQLKVALDVFAELNVIEVDLIAIAKEEGRHDKGITREQIFLKEKAEAVMLKPNSPILFLLQNIRDEAHRFVLGFHRKRRSKKTFSSQMDEIPGIGPVKRKRLLNHFGSVKNIAQASEEELKKVKGVTSKDCQAIKEALGSSH